jgi:hypothetical protein
MFRKPTGKYGSGEFGHTTRQARPQPDCGEFMGVEKAPNTGDKKTNNVYISIS